MHLIAESTSRKPSIRFNVPPPSPPAPVLINTPSTTAELNEYHNSQPKSPFADPNNNTIFESDDPTKGIDDGEMYLVDITGHETETTMKRHRWGTTRNKKGRPKKENVNRSKTLRRLLHPHAGDGNSRAGSRKASSNSHGNGNNNNSDESLPHVDDNDLGSDNDEDMNKVHEVKDPRDRKEESRTVVFNRVLPEAYLDPETGKPLTDYPRNKIRTTKYTPLNFVPKNVTFQFLHNVANIYFLAMIILGAFSIFGVPSPVLAAVPLIVIVIITAIKDAIEDSRRTGSDMEVNNQVTHILAQNVENPQTEYIYENNNIDDEHVSLWRRFKKWNSRVLFKTIDKSKENFTLRGRALKKRRKMHQEVEDHEGDARKSFESDIGDFESPRASMESANPFTDVPRQSLDIQKSLNAKVSIDRGRKSGKYGRKSNHFARSKKLLHFTRKYWKDIRVGDVVRVYNNEEIPADLVILATSDDDGCCYVETKNLDGETNLKVKQALKYGFKDNEIRRADDLASKEFEIDSEGPHPNLYLYEGNLKYTNPETNDIDQETITINNLLLRGCFLRNTKWVIGVTVFTGSDTKIMLNAGVTPTKQSRISRELNYYVLLNFILLFILCFASGLVNGLYYRQNNTSRDYFEFGTIAGSPFKNGLVDFFVALILYQSLVPISLYITIEIIKTAQAFFIYSDVNLYYERLDFPCVPKSWSISDDLGQIEYIFSDKTGTLTQNLMEFKKCTINGVSYGRAYTEALAGMRKRMGIDVEHEALVERAAIAEDKIKMIEGLKSLANGTLEYEDEVTFISSEFVDDLNGARGDYQKQCDEHFMLCLALCHSVLAEEDPKDPAKLVLKAQSPDEAALVGTARSIGFAFQGLNKSGVILDIQGTRKVYQVLNIIEFNSTRKRMSAIVKIPGETAEAKPKALLICKGADSIIYGRLSKLKNDSKLLDETSKQLAEYATEGLRTLCIAQRELTWDQYTEWNKRHLEAASSLNDREGQMEAVADSIERELILLGGTAIEDRLQDGVPESIAILGQAGIKLWVLTGDKVETAINIGFSCNLLGNDMDLLLIKNAMSKEEKVKAHIDPNKSFTEAELVDQTITQYLEHNFQMTGSYEELEKAIGDHSPPNEGFGIVIDGDALKIALSNKLTERKFLLLCKQCKAVLCCRVSPAQKAAVVKLVKNTLEVMTLAIGDGSNDVAMIQAADVGVGIAGEEGRQAVMSSDYAIGQFRFLVKLLLAHGRWSYKRFSEMIPSFFYKNVIFSVALFWYGVYSDFDGTYLFEFTYLMFYNLAFTSLPVIFLGIFDQDVSGKVSMLVPQLYITGIKRSEFTDTKFWVYMIDAVYQSVISFFYPYFMYYTSFASKDGQPFDHRFWMGIAVTSIACISCNCYILLHQYRWDYLSLFIVFLSILFIYIWTGLWTSSTYSGEFYKAAAETFGELSYWAVTCVGVVVCLLPRFFYDVTQKMVFPKDIDIIRECVKRGDFDAYPESYDPTDPNKVKISEYTSSITKRLLQGAHHRQSSVGSRLPDLEDQIAYAPGSSSTIVQSAASSPYKMAGQGSTDESDATVPGLNEETKFHSNPHQNARKLVIDVFKRKQKATSSFSDYSSYDNGSLINDYTFDNHRQSEVTTEEIPLEDFDNNRRMSRRISSDTSRRLSGHQVPNSR